MATYIMVCPILPFLSMLTSMKLNLHTDCHQINMKCAQKLIQFYARKNVRLVFGICLRPKKQLHNMLNNSLLVRILSVSMG